MTNRKSAIFLALTLAACSSAPPPRPSELPVASEPATKLELHTFTSDAAGFDTHSYWLDTGKEVVVFDAQFSEASAKQLADQIREQTKSPIRWVVVTHPNPDKFNGVGVFRALGARSVASAATAKAIGGVHAYKRHFFVEIAKMIPADAYPSEPVIDQTFSGRFRLPLAQGQVELVELENPGVSSTQTVAWIPSSRSLVVGDLVHHRAHAWLEGGIVNGKPRPEIDGWIRALGELEQFPGATVYGGRGEPGPVAEVVAAQRAYLERAREIVRAYVSELGDRKSELSGPRASEHHKAIAQKLSAQFPERGLAYLVEYGVYGLAQQVAQR